MSTVVEAEKAPSSESQFIRGIGPLAAVSMVVGAMIGSGIFIVSADIARQTSAWGPGGLMLVWILTGLMTVTGALMYAELAAMMPRAGGQYVFLREGLSPWVGFLYGWTLFTVIQTGTIAAVAVALFRLRSTQPDLPRPVRAIGYPVVPALYALALLGIMVVLLVEKPEYTRAGLLIVALGVPVYAVWRKLGTPVHGDGGSA